MIEINKELINHIERNVLPVYVHNDEGHRIKHINYVIDRSLRFASTINDINYDMVYTIAAYHDVGIYIDRENHEIISGEMLYHDNMLRLFFNEEELVTMKEAVEDHRASLETEPRTVYGRIVSSADRNTDIDDILRRTYAYRKNIMKEKSIEQIIENSRKHIIEKFGKSGYAITKMYFPDPEYDEYLRKLSELASDKEMFRERYILVNKI